MYGTFAFRPGGYALLGRSLRCREAWVEAFVEACRRFGEPTRDAEVDGALLCRRLPGGPWMIVGVSDQGTDDRGRPGALAFHAFFLRDRAFHKMGYDPFVVAPRLRRTFSIDDRVQPTVVLEAMPPKADPTSPLPRAVALLKQGRRVVIRSSVPATEALRAIYRSMPVALRRRKSLATFAGSDADGYDLAVVSESTGLEPGPRTALLDPIEACAIEAAEKGVARPRWGLAATLGIVALCAGALWLAWAKWGRHEPVSRAVPGRVSAAYRFPVMTAEESRGVADEEARRAHDGLVELAEAFGVAVDPAESSAVIMKRISDSLRYRGPVLSAAELARLRGGADGPRFAVWHRQIARFLPDRPLPEDFARLPLLRQLNVLCLSFHVEPDPGLTAAEIPHALADALCSPEPVSEARAPADSETLRAYARFLAPLPVR